MKHYIYPMTQVTNINSIITICAFSKVSGGTLKGGNEGLGGREIN